MGKVYAVRKGRTVGIFNDWTVTEQSVKGYRGAEFKSFSTVEDARAYLGDSSSGAVTLPASSVVTASHASSVVTASRSHSIAYTDGSCAISIGGYGWCVLSSEGNIQKEACGRVPYNPCTNQKAELYAILHLLSSVSGPLLIRTDSAYSIGCLTQWHHEWQRNGWKTSHGSPVANENVIREILAVMNDRDIRFEHVRGHAGNKYNEHVDKLAERGRLSGN